MPAMRMTANGQAARRAERLPGAFGLDAVLRPRQRRGQRRVLVDPAAVMVAVDRDGGEIDDRGEPRRRGDGASSRASVGSTPSVGRDRDEKDARLRDRLDEGGRGRLAVEHDHLDRASTEAPAASSAALAAVRVVPMMRSNRAPWSAT